MRYLISGIKYDEGHADLPKTLILEVDEGIAEDDLEFEASEFISNETGYCHRGFSLDKME